MSLHSAPFYWVTCDRCGARCPSEGDEFAAWQDESQANDYATDGALWWTEAGYHLCWDCVPLDYDEYEDEEALA